MSQIGLSLNFWSFLLKKKECLKVCQNSQMKAYSHLKHKLSQCNEYV